MESDELSSFISDNPAHRPLFEKLWETRTKLVLVIGPEDPYCSCGDWVGTLLSVSEKIAGIPSLTQALNDGLLHPGCRHHVIPFDASRISQERLHAIMERSRRALDIMGKRCMFTRSFQPLKVQASSCDKGNRAETVNHMGKSLLQTKFERVYESARKALAAQDIATARLKCRAALDLLNEGVIFPRNQETIVHILQTHLKRLESHPLSPGKPSS